MRTQSSAHAKCNIVRISVDYSGAQRLQTGRFGKCSSASAVEGFNERYKTPKVVPTGSTLLDCVGDELERLEIRAGDCEAREIRITHFGMLTPQFCMRRVRTLASFQNCLVMPIQPLLRISTCIGATSKYTRPRWKLKSAAKCCKKVQNPESDPDSSHLLPLTN